MLKKLLPIAFYFIPITYAAWRLGRKGAVVTALLADIPEVFEEIRAVQSGLIPEISAAGNVLLRLAIYIFVAEVTIRLLESNRETRAYAENLKTLNDNLQNANQRLDEDLKAAGTLQTGVLAFTPPEVPGWGIGASVNYAGPIGGDYADAGVVDDRIYVCVADISGKGIPAALFTALLEHLLHDAHERGLRGADVIQAVNSALYKVMPPETFITLFYAEINPDDGKVEFVNAGHTEGLIYRSQTSGLETVGPNCTILAITEELTVRPQDSLTLLPGDTLVLYTDGATESKTLQGQRFGEDLIRQLIVEFGHLDAQSMTKSICEKILAIINPEYRDDLTVLCVQRSRLR
jgi:sigma-B regulation protein RsbU (phosphoserine phosphatase)